MDLLQADDIHKHYGGVAALQGATIAVRAGEVHALVGENGAGKSTLARIIAGCTRADRGRILIDGNPVRIATPGDAQSLGIGIIYQELDLFRHLTVGENLVIGNLEFREGPLVNFRRMEAFCRPFLDQVGLECKVRREVATLPIGQMQLLAIARALSMNARLILMDEPTSALFEDAAERLFGLIAGLKQRGVAIMYVSHKMNEIFRLAGRITVLRDGMTTGSVETARTNTGEVIRMMIGRDLETAGRVAHSPGDVVLRVEDLCTAKLNNVSFELRRGEVLGVAGLVGSGRSELGAALFGMDRITSGAIHRQGTLGLVPEDRRLQGLMMQLSVAENATLAVLPSLQTMGFLHRRRESREMEALQRQLDLHCRSPHDAVATLSGGNQQKVLLGRWLLVNPDVLFLDDPTRGIDVGAKQDIYRTIDTLARGGKGVILVSSELPELIQCCDRILVLSEGHLAATYSAGEATQEKILAAAANAGGPA
ncbi:fused D-ribose transporter subunits of ABC superfamily: ATP-binding components [Candidatus Sulfopaludibacter sp. SbA3]|nr:fused D-ribose transporter subunits of ABC superfamily: ATP-binding components [Candidatus Sulfopaludibacter sp. SbA3]